MKQKELKNKWNIKYHLINAKTFFYLSILFLMFTIITTEFLRSFLK